MATVQTRRGWLTEGDVSNLRNIRDTATRGVCEMAMSGDSNAQNLVADLIAEGK